MDSITHLAIGAIIGHQTARTIPRKKAMLLGAFTQSLPDIDFLAYLWLDPANNLLAHRGFTHSILFSILTSSMLALIMDRWQTKPKTDIKYWFFFFALQAFVHLFIDVMNVYGVGLLEPFDHRRFSVNTVFVADPLFSIWPAMAAIALLFTITKRWKTVWSWVGIGGPSMYLIIVFFIKYSIVMLCREEFAEQRIRPSKYIITPTPLNAMLWYIVAEQHDGYIIGYRSIFDHGSIDFKFFARHDELLGSVQHYEDLQHLKRFSQGYYIITKKNDKIVFSDLRFGQIFGWIDPEAEFVFQFNLEKSQENTLVVQRGRFAKVTGNNVVATAKRIAGK